MEVESLSRPDHRSIGQYYGPELERSAAMRTHCRPPWLGILRLDLGKTEAVAQLDKSPDGIQPDFAVRVHEAEVSDFHETGG